MLEKQLQQNIDSWVKAYNDQLHTLNNNINHNYELIKDLRGDINEINTELKVIKILIILFMKNIHEVKQK